MHADKDGFVVENNRRTIGRPVTGRIHIDRIWEQWYSDDAMSSVFPQMNQTEYLYRCIGNEPERVIIDYRGKRKYTFGEFKRMVERFEKAFAALNLPVGSVVCTIALTTPEMYAIKYAATAIGIVTCNLNVLDAGITDNGENRLHRQMKLVNPKVIFILDCLEDKVSEIVNHIDFSGAVKILLPMDASLPLLNLEKLALAVLHIKNRIVHKNIAGCLSLLDFLRKGTAIDKLPAFIYEPKLPCNIAFSSGTTGINKAILISHDANNALAFQHAIGGFGFYKGEKQLALAPPFLAFWDADIVHTVLAMGGENIIEVDFSYNAIPKFAKKYLPQVGVCSQYLWSSILHLPEKELELVSDKLRHVIVGGERCELNQMRSFYRKTGIKQMCGFGASEVNTAFTLTHPSCHKFGSAGIPLPFNNVKILDDSGNECTYNQSGRLYITGPCLMNEYYGRPELTQAVLIPDENGVLWYDTRDYAIMDEDGCLTVLDRDSESVLINFNGHEERIKLLDINETIMQNENVKHSKMNVCNGKIFLYLVIDPFIDVSPTAAMESVLSDIKEKLPEICQPDVIVQMDELPRTQVGKVDYQELERFSKNYYEKIESKHKLEIVKYS